MSESGLKEYVNKVKELEVAIYTQKELMNKHKVVLDESYPVAPSIKDKDIVIPSEPVWSNYEPKDERKPMYLYIAGSTFVVMAFIFWGLEAMFVGSLCFAVGIFYIVMTWNSRSDYKKSLERAKREYEYDKLDYPHKVERYKKLHDKALSEYRDLYDLYVTLLAKCNDDNKKWTDKHNKALQGLELALNQLYDEDVIFPKYRNIVAISTISEYLESGRCSELEGANGAYNLYEMELRQNIVIGQLSIVVNNLEQIRNNQYSLYEELTKSNQMIGDIVYEIKHLNNTTKLNAYFNYVAAKVAAAPKITYGRIYS